MTDKKIAIVTGANRGMGLESSRQLGRLGFKVVMCCRDLTAGEQAAEALKADGSDVEQPRGGADGGDARPGVSVRHSLRGR